VINRPMYFTACAILGLMVGIGGAEAVTPPPAKPATTLVTSPSEVDTSEAESGEPRRKAASDTPDVPAARVPVARSTPSKPVTQSTGTPATVKAQEVTVSEQDPEPEPEPQDQPQVKEPTVRAPKPDPVIVMPPEPPAVVAPPAPKSNESVPNPGTPEPSQDEPVTPEQ
jgi:hypothetical protein